MTLVGEAKRKWRRLRGKGEDVEERETIKAHLRYEGLGEKDIKKMFRDDKNAANKQKKINRRSKRVERKNSLQPHWPGFVESG